MIQIHPLKPLNRRNPSMSVKLPLSRLPTLIVLLIGIAVGAGGKDVFFPTSPFSEWQAPAVEHVPVRVCFTPTRHCTSGIIHAINTAKSSIYVQAYSFTSAPIAQALVDAKDRGVDIHILADKSQISAKGSQIHKLAYSKIPVLIDQVPGLAHNKVIIIDHTHVITGSFNFSHAADSRNAENVILLHNPALAQLYQENWKNRSQNAIIF